MEAKEYILRAILAATDATWLPDRKPGQAPRCVTLYERRRGFATDGLPWNSNQVHKSLSDAERKHIGRTLRQMPEWVEVFDQRHGRAENVRLTSAGDDHIRGLCGLPRFSDSAIVLDRLWEFHDHPLAIDQGALWYTLNGPAGFPGAWHHELPLSRCPWPTGGTMPASTRRQLVRTEELMLPLLWRCLVVSGAMTAGGVMYALTPAGIELAQERKGKPAAPGAVAPEPCEELRCEYYATIKAELVAIETEAPQYLNEIGELPLSMAPEKLRPGAAEAWAEVYGATVGAAK